MIIRIMYISCKKGMIKALKRNQIIIFAIALMLITAGYLNYTMQSEETAQTSGVVENQEIAGIGDAKLVSSNNISSENTISNNVTSNMNNSIGQNTINNVITNNTTSNNNENSNNVSETSAKVSEDLDRYFTESRLEREKMYSEMLESYQTILASSNISSEQKSSSQNEISNINSQKNAIMIAENLIKNKGFKDVVIFANKGSISVVVRAEKLEEAEIAQIQSIVQRELGVNVENIHISNK
ncbi:MAG: SpoIIIAH-like family protein [Clostridia bacterium]|nr:SpoIIIAH-like family protein [Clostridia bacterium]